MKLPRIFAMCEDCPDETNCHPLSEVRYDGEQWLCTECYGDFRTPKTTLKDAPSAAEFATLKGQQHDK